MDVGTSTQQTRIKRNLGEYIRVSILAYAPVRRFFRTGWQILQVIGEHIAFEREQAKLKVKSCILGHKKCWFINSRTVDTLNYDNNSLP